MSSFQAWVEKRNAALMTLDMDWVREQVGPVDSGVLLMSLHKARYSCTAIDRTLRLESAEWLRERYYGDFDGMPLLPRGELPE